MNSDVNTMDIWASPASPQKIYIYEYKSANASCADRGRTGAGTVTRGMIRERAVELALNDGRLAHEASQADWEQARQELTGVM